MKSRYIKIGIISMSMAMGVMSCDKKIELENPNGLTVDAYNKNTDELTKSVLGIYAAFQGPGLVGRRWIELQETRSDETVNPGPFLEAPEAQIVAGTHDASNQILDDVWRTAYVLILRANGVLDAMPKASGAEALKNQLAGEAKFLRGWAYFQLVAMWGPVPLHTTIATGPFANKPRASVEEVYAQVIQDLTDAEANLPEKGTAETGRATKGAAQALLGWVHLQRLEYAKAKAQFDKVINSGKYSLTDKYADNFLEETEYNQESLFEVGFQYSNGNFGWGNNPGDGLNNIGESTMRNQDFNGFQWRNYIPSSSVLMEYENIKAGDPKTDPRLIDNVYFVGDKFNNGTMTVTAEMQRGNTVKYYGEDIKASWKKYTYNYKNNEGYYPGGINYRMIRYGFVLAMAAECEIELNNLPGALTLLNKLRARPSVNMTPYPTGKYLFGTKAEAIKTMMHEKRAETAGEEVRNFDLLRWRKAGYFAGGADPLSYFQPRHELLPIPQVEMANNPLIGAQNQGY